MNSSANPRTNRILVVDDDARIRDLLRRYLTQEGFEVLLAEDSRALNKQLTRETVDLIVLDLMLPGEDGLTICRRLRAANDSTPIIMLTAKVEDVDRIVGLEVGADDYLAKPFNPRELLARIKAITRRAGHEKAQAPRYYAFNGFTLDLLERRLIDPDGTASALSGMDYQLLKLLVEHPGEVLDRSRLAEVTRGRDLGPLDRSLDVQVSRLRQRLQDDGKQPALIKTVRGSGYVFSTTVTARHAL